MFAFLISQESLKSSFRLLIGGVKVAERDIEGHDFLRCMAKYLNRKNVLLCNLVYLIK